MEKPHLPVQAGKLPCFMGGGIWPRTKTCVNCGGRIAMVPCLHQGNVHINRKLRVWRAQKYIALVGAETPLNCAGWQRITTQGGRYMAENENLRKLGLVIAMVPCLHQRNIYLQRKLQIWREQKCIPLVSGETPL